MIVIEKNVGPKIEYELDEKLRLHLGDDEMTLRLDKLERDWPVHLDICRNEYDILVMSTATGLFYVAQLDIPAAEYTEPIEDDEGEIIKPAEKKPLDPDKVVLTLWAEQ